jgi:hypothetical protein
MRELCVTTAETRCPSLADLAFTESLKITKTKYRYNGKRSPKINTTIIRDMSPLAAINPESGHSKLTPKLGEGNQRRARRASAKREPSNSQAGAFPPSPPLLAPLRAGWALPPTGGGVR